MAASRQWSNAPAAPDEHSLACAACGAGRKLLHSIKHADGVINRMHLDHEAMFLLAGALLEL